MTREKRQPSREDLLADIVDWGARLADHVCETDGAAFLAERLRQDAVCRCLEVIGEASRRLLAADPGIEQRYPALELRRAYAARNRIAHGYEAVDYQVVWTTAVEAVPRLVAAALGVLAIEREC